MKDLWTQLYWYLEKFHIVGTQRRREFITMFLLKEALGDGFVIGSSTEIQYYIGEGIYLTIECFEQYDYRVLIYTNGCMYEDIRDVPEKDVVNVVRDLLSEPQVWINRQNIERAFYE